MQQFFSSEENSLIGERYANAMRAKQAKQALSVVMSTLYHDNTR
jgi:hypothetical protein